MALSAQDAAQQMCDVLIEVEEPLLDRLDKVAAILKRVPKNQRQEAVTQLPQLLDRQPNKIKDKLKLQIGLDDILKIVGCD